MKGVPPMVNSLHSFVLPTRPAQAVVSIVQSHSTPAQASDENDETGENEMTDQIAEKSHYQGEDVAMYTNPISNYFAMDRFNPRFHGTRKDGTGGMRCG
jgi:hypothetical protein